MTDLERLARGLAAAEERLEKINQWIVDAEKASEIQTENEEVRSAHTTAIFQALSELAAREGLAQELFLLRFLELVRWHRGRNRGITDDNDPSLAARIDERNPIEMPLSEAPPTIFRPSDP